MNFSIVVLGWVCYKRVVSLTAIVTKSMQHSGLALVSVPSLGTLHYEKSNLRLRRFRCVIAFAVLQIVCGTAAAQVPTIINPSFEADTFTNWPGYVGSNGPITGWTALYFHGLNPVPHPTDPSPFADNGTIPDGSKIAFLQGEGPLSQAISGFIVGSVYQIRYFENARICCTNYLPFLEVRIGTNTIVAAHAVTRVGGTNSYNQITSDPFIAYATTMELAFIKSHPQGGDNTVLIDNVQIIAWPMVTVSATDPEAGETGDPGQFTITRAGSTNADLTIGFSYGGTATRGADYVSANAPVTIPAGATSMALSVMPIDDLVPEPDETVVLTLAPGPGYTLGTPANATVSIFDHNSGPPAITTQPQGQTICLGASNVTFSVAAAGAQPLSYQWLLNGVSIPGAASSNYTIANLQLTNGGNYAVRVLNGQGAKISSPAALTFSSVCMPPPPYVFVAPADNFLNAVPINGSSGLVLGTNFSATNEASEPRHSGKRGGSSVWYAWVAPAEGIATFNTIGSGFDTLLAVYRGQYGSQSNQLSELTEVAADDDSGGYGTSLLRFNAMTNVIYYVAIDGLGGEQGNFILAWALEAGQRLPEIVVQPSCRTVRLSDGYIFNVVASGENLNYQWYFNNSALAGANSSTFIRSKVRPEHVGFYKVLVSDTNRQVFSRTAILEIGPVPDVQSVGKLPELFGNDCHGPMDSLVRVKSVSTMSETPISIPVRLGDIDTHVLNNLHGGSSTCTVNQCQVFPGTYDRSRMLCFYPSNNGNFVISTAADSLKTVLSIWRYAPGQAPFVDCPTRVICASSDSSGVALVRFQAEAYSFYVAQIDGVGTATNICLNYMLGPPPGLPLLSASNAVPLGETVTLGIEVGWHTFPNQPGCSPSPPITYYQWRSNNVPVGTNRLLGLGNVQSLAPVVYSVVITNITGAVTVQVANVKIDSSLLTLAESTFEMQTDGWKWRPSAGSQWSEPVLFADPDGLHSFYVAAGQQTLASWQWIAPSKFLGNKSAAYGGRLEFDLRQQEAAVVLIGGGLTLSNYVVTRSAGTDWVSYRALLTNNAGWRILRSNDVRLATREELLHTLGYLSSLQILAASSSSGSAGMDNVVLIAPATNDVVYLVGPGSDPSTVVEWPVTARDFALEAKTDFKSTNWAAYPLQGLRTNTSQGLIQATNSFLRTTPRVFFRARHR